MDIWAICDKTMTTEQRLGKSNAGDVSDPFSVRGRTMTTIWTSREKPRRGSKKMNRMCRFRFHSVLLVCFHPFFFVGVVMLTLLLVIVYLWHWKVKENLSIYESVDNRQELKMWVTTLHWMFRHTVFRCLLLFRQFWSDVYYSYRLRSSDYF